MSLQLQIEELQLDLMKVELSKAFDESKHPRGKQGRWASGVSLKLINQSNRFNVLEDDWAILDSKGNSGGFVRIDRSNTKSIEVSDIVIQGHANTLGPSLIRHIARQLKSLYPQAETISGKRISGARRGPASKDEDNLSPLQLGGVVVRTKLIKQLEKAFNPNEPRDSHGRWAKDSQTDKEKEEEKAFQDLLDKIKMQNLFSRWVFNKSVKQLHQDLEKIEKAFK